MVVACAGLTAFAVAHGRALADELPAHQRIDFGDHRALAHAERPRDGVGAQPTLVLLFFAGTSHSFL
ncbi:MAG: hypothetical protein FWE48_07640 [Coriobacteriia bacterium]|nr:hypothetical protein [Coriobacteriia bacterium]